MFSGPQSEHMLTTWATTQKIDPMGFIADPARRSGTLPWNDVFRARNGGGVGGRRETRSPPPLPPALLAGRSACAERGILRSSSPSVRPGCLFRQIDGHISARRLRLATNSRSHVLMMARLYGSDSSVPYLCPPFALPFYVTSNLNRFETVI
jgi:hypothetical protein